MIKQNNSSNSATDLKVSIILTVLNEGSNIHNVISNLVNQTRQPDEIVVCDGGSKDNTLSQLQQVKTGDVPLRVVVKEGACRGAGRNCAIEAAVNPIIALIDGGMIADSQWLERLLLPCIADSSVEVVYGSVIPQLKGRFSRCLAALTVGHSHIKGRLYPSVASLLICRRIWRKVGGFPEGLTTAEDLIFLDRLKAYEIASEEAPDAVTYWSIPTSLSAVFRRLSLYSQGGLAAGFAKRWHYGTFRNFCIFAFLIWLGIVIHLGFFIGLPCFQVLRVHKYISNMPRIQHCNFFNRISDYVIATFILATMDLATFNGLLRWILLDRCHRKKITCIGNDFSQEKM